MRLSSTRGLGFYGVILSVDETPSKSDDEVTIRLNRRRSARPFVSDQIHTLSLELKNSLSNQEIEIPQYLLCCIIRVATTKQKQTNKQLPSPMVYLRKTKGYLSE